MSVTFDAIELREIRIPFRFSFKHALAERQEAHALSVALRLSSGHVGYGEVHPRSYLTGETIESAWKDMGEEWWPRLRELSLPGEVEGLSQTLNPRDPEGMAQARRILQERVFPLLRPLYLEADRAKKTASYAGIDLAAVDAVARFLGLPGRELFGPSPPFVLLTAPLGGKELGWTKILARLFRYLGFRHFKVKVLGKDDLSRIRAIRKVVGKERDLRIDANGAWEVDEAVAIAQALHEEGICAIEQPIAAPLEPAARAQHFADLARIQREGKIPVIADESLCTLADAKALLAQKAAAIWNVRLAKIGGFSGMREMVQLARENRIQLHLGVLVGETSLLAAAGRACLGMGDFRYVEYGFPRILLRSDPFRGGPGGYRGRGYPLRSTAGLGVFPLANLYDTVTLRRQILQR